MARPGVPGLLKGLLPLALIGAAAWGVGQVAPVFHQFGEERLPGRHVEGVDDTKHEREGHDLPGEEEEDAEVEVGADDGR